MGQHFAATLDWLGRRKPMSEIELRVRYREVTDQLEAAQRAFRELEQAAADAGLGRVWRALVSPPAPTPTETEPMGRYRIVQGFSSEYRSRPLAAYAGSVVDLPRRFAQNLSAGMVEEVGFDVPISYAPVRW